MKKTLLIIAIFTVCFFVSNAQFNTGQKFIAGGLSFNSYTMNYTDTSSYKTLNTGINFSMGKFISPLHSIGWGVFYNYSHVNLSSSIPTDKSNTNDFGANFFSNYYQPLFKNFYAMVSWNNSVSVSLSNNNENGNGSGFSIGSSLNPGFVYQLNKRFLFNATLTNLISLGYSTMKYDKLYKSSNQFSFSSSLRSGNLSNVSLGFTYLLK